MVPAGPALAIIPDDRNAQRSYDRTSLQQAAPGSRCSAESNAQRANRRRSGAVVVRSRCPYVRRNAQRSAQGGHGTVTAPADTLITGGTIVDGTGLPGRPGTIAISGDRLRILDGE